MRADLKRKARREEPCANCLFNSSSGNGELRQRGLPQAQDGDANESAGLVASLRICSRNKDLCKGRRLHDEILQRGLLKSCSDSLASMYATCGALAEAKALLEKHKSKDVLTWTALIAGCAQKDHGQIALDYFEKMQHEGLAPDAVTYSCILKACGSIRAIEKGEKIHDDIAKQGLLENNIVLGNALLTMYAKCGALTKAQQVLEELPVRNVISWTALIAGYTEHGEGKKALNCFERMQHEGLSPNAVTFTCALKACGSIRAAHEGEKIHSEIAKQGLLKYNQVLGNALIDMYAKCGALASAEQVLEELPNRNIKSWNAMITGYTEHGKSEQALYAFDQMQCEGLAPDDVTFLCILKACGSTRAIGMCEKIHDQIGKERLLGDNIMLGTALVDTYAKCGALAKAWQVLEELPVRDVSSWTALIAGYAEHGECEQALSCLKCMEMDGLSPNAVTFVCILKACGRLGAADKGEQMCDEITKEGLARNDVVLGSALVDIYVKCGALAKAHRVLEELPVRNVISWTALIAGYVAHGEGEQAMYCFEQMQHEGIIPSAATCVCVLKACGSIQALKKGELIHTEFVKQGSLENIELGNALVDMYGKCGALAKAQQVLQDLPVRDVISWTALIAGYAEHGKGEQALDCFEQMQSEGFSPNGATLVCSLKACGRIRAVDRGAKVHDVIMEQGLLGSDPVLCTALVDMYVKCGALPKARKVLEEPHIESAGSWNALIAGYVENGEAAQALNCSEHMQRKGVSSDAVTFTCILKACSSIGSLDKGIDIHDKVTSQGLLQNDIVLGNALVDMYANCGTLSKARQVLEELPNRDVLSWTALIAGYSKHGKGKEALECFELMQHEGLSPVATTFVSVLRACGSMGAAEEGEKLHRKVAELGWPLVDTELGTAVVDMYAKCGAFGKAREFIEEFPDQKVRFWNALIAAYIEHGEAAQALNCFEQMQCEGLSPDALTFACILKAYGSIGAADRGEKMHYEIAKQELLGNDDVLGSALLDMYVKCGTLPKAWQVLEELPVRNVISWTTLIAGYAEHGEGAQALTCFESMLLEGLSPSAVTFSCILRACGSIGAGDKGEKIHGDITEQGLLGSDDVLGTALVDMYAKCGALARAWKVLEELPGHNVVSWNALIAGYVKHGEGAQALVCFEQMQHEGLTPDGVTFSAVLRACGSVGAAGMGEQIRDEIAKQGLLRKDVVLGTALVDMVANCSTLSRARQVLEELPIRNVTSWNALITGYVQQCQSTQALSCLEQMQSEGLSPDAATLSCVLSACSRLSLVEDAQHYFLSMSAKYGMKPDLDHYACMVDLFGRAGHLDRAIGVIEKMPSFTGVAWSALLGACSKWGDVDVGRWAFEQAVLVDVNDGSVYVLMANIYAASGLQEDAESIEAMRLENKVWKRPTQSSWTNINKYERLFMVGGMENSEQDRRCDLQNIAQFG